MGKSESRIQQEIVVSFNNRMPQLRGLLCYNLNNSIGGKRGKDNKYMGLIAGRSDMVFYYKMKAYHIELKTETGIQKPEQKKWEKIIRSQSFSYTIVRSLDEFWHYILPILHQGQEHSLEYESLMNEYYDN